MTKATAYFLNQLKIYLDAQPASKRRELIKLHEKLADGKKIFKQHLSRHLNLVAAPHMDTVLVYLRFAQLNNLITPGTAETGLFLYVNDKPRINEREKALVKTTNRR